MQKMKLFLVIAALLLGATAAQEWTVAINSTSLKVEMEKTVTVPIFITIPNYADISSVKLSHSNSNPEIAIVDEPDFHNNWNGQSPWIGKFNVTGVFLGNAQIIFKVVTDEGTYNSEELSVAVIRPHKVINTIFTASVIALVSVLYINFGCAMDWSVCRNTLRRPIGPAIGAFCQFLIMPTLAYFIGQLLFPDRPELQLGIFFTGISPSGGASNIWTVLLGGNLNLSVTMTTLGTIASFATMPIWIFTLGARIFDNGKLGVPYSTVAMMACGLVIPLGLGYIIQKKLPKLSRILVRVLKPCSIILIIFIIVFAIVTNLYLFKLFSWQIVVAGMGLAWGGYICGWIAMIIFRQPDVDVRAIAIETGIQNTGISILLLQLCLPQPAADLTTVIPVSSAIMTPLPLTVLWIVKLFFDHRKKKLASSTEKLNKIGEPISAITPTSQTTIIQ